MRSLHRLSIALTIATLAGCRQENILMVPADSVGRASLGLVVNLNVPRVPLAVGRNHACALNRTGRAFCWGDGQFGQLGTGNSGQNYASYTPVAVAQGALNFSALSASYLHTCALTSGGKAYCWGGLEEYGDATVPRAVPQDTLRFTSIQTGSRSTCALTADGSAYCWGGNYFGQLGNGRNGSYVGNDVQPVPQRVLQGTLVFTSLTLNGYTACGLTAGRLAYCWGSDENGQVGDGRLRSSAPTPTAVQQGSLRFVSIQVENQTTCGLTAPGQAYCWGENFYGQYGNGTAYGDPYYQSLYPTPAGTGHSFASLSPLVRGRCGLTAAGQVFCWGWDVTGELGNADTTLQTQLFPDSVRTPLVFRMLAAGGAETSTCALTAAGQVWCWGLNNYGQLGIGNNGGVLEPYSGFFYIPYPVQVLTNELFR